MEFTTKCGFSASPVVPVMVIKNLDDALPMAQALSAGGINVFEITLRSAVALDAIKIIADAMPDTLVGAGTVISRNNMTQQWRQALNLLFRRERLFLY